MRYRRILHSRILGLLYTWVRKLLKLPGASTPPLLGSPYRESAEPQGEFCFYCGEVLHGEQDPSACPKKLGIAMLTVISIAEAHRLQHQGYIKFRQAMADRSHRQGRR